MRRIVVAGGLAVLHAAAAIAGSAASINGTVYDPTRGVIVGATATLEALDASAAPIEARSGADGRFDLGEADPSGRYRLTVRAAGFSSQVREIGGGSPRPLRIMLQPEGLSEEVSVEASTHVPTRNASATRTDTPLAEIPQSISVVTSEQIQEREAETLQEVVSYSAGVRADPYGLDNRNDWFIVRGSADTITVIDGLRAPLIGYWGGRQEPFAYEHVDVLRGPSSVLVGQTAPGGVVNLVSKQPQQVSLREVALELGSRSHKEATADLTGPLNDSGTVLYRVLALGRLSDGQVDFTNDDRQFAGSALTFQPDSATSLTAYGEFMREDNQSSVGFFPWSGMLLPAPFGRIAPERFLSEPDWDSYVVKRTRLGYRFSRQIGSAWSLRQQLRHDRLNGDMRSMYSNFWEGFLEDQRSVNRTWYATSYRGHTTSADLLAEGHVAWGPTRHTLLLGADGGWFWDGTRFLEGAATPLDLYAPVYGTFEPPVLDYGPVLPARTRQIGLFVQDQAKVNERLVLVAGLRRDEVRTELEGSEESGSDSGAWSSRAGVVGLLGKWAPYASYSESFEAVGGADVDNVPYKPKRGRQYEVGLRFSPGVRLNATLAAYTLNETNRLSPDPTNPVNQVQRGEVRVRGIELETTASLRDWDLLASYTYTDGEVVKSSDPADPYLGKHLLSIPDHSAAAWVVRKQRVGAFALRAGGGVRYTGKAWDGQDLLQTPANTLLDAMASLERSRWRLALNATNLLDDVYIATCIDRGDCWWGSRRRVVASLGYRF